MANIKEAKELLEEIGQIRHRISFEDGIEVAYFSLDDRDKIYSLAHQALSALADKPVCKEEAIKEAIEAIKQRRQGRYKLVYDKPSRTIVAVPNPNYSPACETCNDTRQVGEEETLHGRSMGYKACPDCPPDDEFVRDFRQYLKDNKMSMGFAVHTRATKACDRLDAQKQRIEENRWIPVSEKLPGEKGIYLVLWDTGIVEKIYFNPKTSQFYMKTNVSEVTHWKPIILPDQVLKESPDVKDSKGDK